MNKPDDILINIKTEGDTSGVEAVEKSIFALESAAKKAERELDNLEAQRRKTANDKSGGLTGVDLTKGFSGDLGTKLADATGYGEELKKAQSFAKGLGVEITGAAAADAVAIAGSFAAIGASAVVAFKGVSDSLNDYKDLMTRWREVTGKELDDGSQDILAYAKVFSDIEQPIDDAIDKIGGFISSIAEVAQHPLESLKKLRKEIDGTGDLEDSIKRAEDAKKALDGVIQARANAGQVELAAIYGKEVEKLKEQEDTLKRIGNLRSAMGALEQEGARQEVDSAKQRGGDVALAEANVLATQLRTGLDKLQQNLSESKAAADTAGREADAAMIAYSAAMRDNLDAKKVAELGEKVTDAQTAKSNADQALVDQTNIFQASKNNLLRGAENSLGALEQEYDGKTSAAAKQAFDGIYQNIKTVFQEGPQTAIKGIKVETDAVVTATKAKATEVTESVNKIQTDVVNQNTEVLTRTLETSKNIGTSTENLRTGIASLDENVTRLLNATSTLVTLCANQNRAIEMLELRMQTALSAR